MRVSAPSLSPKPVSASRTVISVVALPRDSNHYGFVYGGTVMGLVDQAAYAAAIRHARQTVVTVCVEQITFLRRIYVGDVITMRAAVNYVGRTSMEVGVRIETERMRTGAVEHVGSAYVTMVALDADGTPIPVPPLELETDDDRRRRGEAAARRRTRVARVRRAERRGHDGR